VQVNEITEAVLGAAIEVHRAIGAGLLESAYSQCLCYELNLRKLPFALELPLPVLLQGSETRLWLSR
jgi:GxxExxY protein